MEERAALLLEQGRYGELLSMLDGIGVAGRDSAEAVLWRVRCRVDQGYLRRTGTRSGRWRCRARSRS